MAQVKGTLWFGTDITDDALRKAQQLRTQIEQQFSKEITLNVTVKGQQQAQQAARQMAQSLTQVQQQVNSVGVADGMTTLSKRIIEARYEIEKLKRAMDRAREKMQTVKSSNGVYSPEYKTARKDFLDARNLYQLEQRALFGLTQRKAELAVQQREENNARQAARDAIRQQSQAQREANQRLKENASIYPTVNTQMQTQISLAQRLSQVLTGMFTITKAKEFLQSVIEIGGQLEQQRVSIGAILHDTAHANDLFDRIKNLALQSPFGVLDLDKYTKQLSAYGFQYNELFDMTKRLADISAGAGTDISRLALALGHVKSATYLTGITLRQFSMNNIPMLKMLSEYYSQLENRIVTTADVQKRIFSRQVGYEAVIDVIKRMTDEGGQFYNMQAIMADTLAGKWKNLKDAVDLMYGSIGEGFVGDVLKDVAGGLTSMTKHWQQVGIAIGAALLYFGRARVATLLMNTALGSNNATLVRNYMLEKQTMANRLTMKAQTQQLTAAEQRLVLTRDRMTTSDYKHLLANKLIDKEYIIRLVRLRQLKIGQAGHLVGLQGLELAELKAAAATKWYNVALEQSKIALRGFSAAAKSAMASLAPMLAMTAAFEIAFSYWQSADQKAQKYADAINEANEAFKNLNETAQQFSVGRSGQMSSSELQQSISDMVTTLKDYAPNVNNILGDAFAKNADGTAVHNLAEQYEILAKGIKNTRDAYVELAKDMPVVQQEMERAGNERGGLMGLFDRIFLAKGLDLGSAVDNYNFDSLEEAIKHYSESTKELMRQETLFGRNHIEIATQLQSMGIANALEMDNAKLIDIIKNMPRAEFEKFRSGLTSDTKDLLDDLSTMWADNGWAFASVFDKLQKAGNEAYLDLKEKYGDDINKWPETWEAEVMLRVKKATDDIQGFSDFALDEQERLKNAYLEPFNITVNTEQAEQGISDLMQSLNNLVGKEWTVRIGIQGKSTIDDAKSAAKAYKEAKENVNDVNKRLKNIPAISPAYAAAQEELKENTTLADKAAETYKFLGGTIEDLEKSLNKGRGGKKGGGGSRRDEELERWKNRIQLLEKYNTEYEKYSKMYGEQQAKEKLKADGDFSALWDYFANPSDYVGSLRQAINALSGSSEGRKNTRDSLNAKIGEFNRKQTEKDFDIANKELETQMKLMEEQFNLYKKIMDATHDKGIAASIAFGGNMQSETLLDYYTKELEMRGAGDAASMSRGDAVKQYGEKSPVLTLYDAIRNEQKKMKEESVELYLEAIKNAKNYETQLKAIDAQYEETVRVINANGGNRTLLQATEDKYNKDRSKVLFDQFKENSNWGRIFADLDRISDETLSTMIEKIKEFATTEGLSVEATKALYEALEKLQQQETKRNPFSGISRYFETASILNAGLAAANRTGGMTIARGQLAKALGVKSGTQVTTRDIKDAQMSNQKDFVNTVNAIADAFKSLQAVLQPVIDLFDALGNESLADLFSIGSNALGAAGNTAGAIGNIAGLFGKDSGLGKALGAAGPYGAAAAAALSVVGSLFSQHDKKLEKSINRSKERVKQLQNFYKNVESQMERTLGGIYSTGGYYDMLDAYKKQLKELRGQRRDEEDKKKTDRGKIIDYDQQIYEMEQNIIHFAEDMAKSIYDIDLKSWAQQLTDAVVGAWAKGTDAAQAWHDKVKEIVNDLTKNVLTQKVVENAMNPVLEFITSEMTAKSGKLDQTTIKTIAEMLDAAGTSSISTITDILEYLKANGYDLSDSASKEGNLSSAINSITEEAGDLIVSYVAAIRADVSMDRANVESIRMQLEQTLPNVWQEIAQHTVLLRTIADNTGRNADSNDDIYNIMKGFRDGIYKIKVS